jgi:N,N'-diacetyllegionaminate synthase
VSIHVCLDPGSTHNGDLHYARRLLEIAADIGADAIKFQLLSANEAKGGNLGMDWAWMPELIALGRDKRIEVFASVFDRSGWDYLLQLGCKSAKLSYSQAHKLDQYPHLAPLETVYVSQDGMSPALVLKPARRGEVKPGPMRLVRYYCIPEYPVQYMLDFEGLFPRFDGFSSHCLGMEQEVRAVQAGAKHLEFHFMGDWASETPDGRFAKSPALAAKLIERVRR